MPNGPGGKKTNIFAWQAIILAIISGIVALGTVIIKEIVAPAISLNKVQPFVAQAVNQPEIREKIAQIGNEVLFSKYMPVGALIPYSGTINDQTIQTFKKNGWLPAIGSPIKRDDYHELFAVIGTSWGNGDGMNTFNLPDLRGRFVRGVDMGTGRDADAMLRKESSPGSNEGDNVGSSQEDEIKKHDHPFVGTPVGSGGWGGSRTYDVGIGDHVRQSTYTPSGKILQTGGNETRPINVYVNWLIKAK